MVMKCRKVVCRSNWLAKQLTFRSRGTTSGLATTFEPILEAHISPVGTPDWVCTDTREIRE